MVVSAGRRLAAWARGYPDMRTVLLGAFHQSSMIRARSAAVEDVGELTRQKHDYFTGKCFALLIIIVFGICIQKNRKKADTGEH